MADYIPRSDIKFHFWAQFLVEGVEAKLDEWEIDKDAFAPLKAAHEGWNAAYAVAAVRQDRTMVDVQRKDGARKALLQIARPFVQKYLAWNDKISDSERVIIGITVRKQGRTRHPVPHSSPTMMIDFSVHQRHRICFRDSHLVHTSKPRGVYAAEVWMRFADMPEDAGGAWRFLGIATKLSYTVSYEMQDRGRQVYYRLRWINACGKAGSWGEEMEAFVG